MAMHDIPFNMNYEIGPDLRDRPQNAEDMRMGVEWLRERVRDAEADVRNPKGVTGEKAIPSERRERRLLAARLHSMIGAYLRMLGDLGSSEAALRESLKLFEREYAVDVPETIAAKMRLAHTLHWMKRFEEADELFETAIVTCGRDPRLMPMRDFVFQHYGKSKFDQGRYGRALEMFEAALRLRQIKGDPSLIDSTQQAIEVTQERMRERSVGRRPAL